MDCRNSELRKRVVLFSGLTFRGGTREILDSAEKPTLVITVNADILVTARENPKLARIIEDNYATFDGQVPYLFARLFAKKNDINIEKISGSDYVVELLQKAQTSNKRVFILGAEPESNKLAVTVCRNDYGVTAEGYSPAVESFPFSVSWSDKVRAHLLAFKPHYIFVALGCPKQEYWMDSEKKFLETLGVELAIGCGGSVDFLSGKVLRAPKIVQKIGLEGLFRILVQPKWFRVKRLFRSFLMFKYMFW